MHRLIARPKPLPPNSRVTELSAWENASKMLSSLSAAMPGPVSITSNAICAIGPAGQPARQLHLAAGGELHSVAHEVHQQLLQAQGVRGDRGRNAVRPTAGQLQALLQRAARMIESTTVTISRGEQRTGSITIRPASIFDRSSTSLINSSKWLLLSQMVLR